MNVIMISVCINLVPACGVAQGVVLRQSIFVPNTEVVGLSHGLLLLGMDSGVCALDITTGRRVWCVRLGNLLHEYADVELEGTVRGGGIVLAYSIGILCLGRQTGRILWHYHSSDYSGIAGVAGNRVIVGERPNLTVALDAQTGRVVWSAPGHPVEVPRGLRWVSVQDASARLLGFDSTERRFLDTTSGRLLWSFVGGSMNYGSRMVLYHHDGRLVVRAIVRSSAESESCDAVVMHGGGEVACFQEGTPVPLWRIVGITDELIGRHYGVAIVSGHVVLFDMRTGRVVQASDDVRLSGRWSLRAFSDRALVLSRWMANGRSDVRVYALSALDGEIGGSAPGRR